MVPTHAAVHIGGGDFMAVHPVFGKKPIEEIEASLLGPSKAALDELVWWAKATMAAKAADARPRGWSRGRDADSAGGLTPASLL